MLNKCSLFFLISLFFLLTSCNNSHKKDLHYLGFPTVENGDTINYTIPDFQFLRQDSLMFGNKELAGKPYVAYFFFTSCPSVCPRMTQGALRVQRSLDKYNDDFNILGFSIDPRRDTLSKLRAYAQEYTVDLNNWHFLRGEESEISAIGKNAFYIGISKDNNEPGGYLHSEKMVLIDAEGHIRGYYSGTDADDVKTLIADLKYLIKNEIQ